MFQEWAAAKMGMVSCFFPSYSLLGNYAQYVKPFSISPLTCLLYIYLCNFRME